MKFRCLRRWMASHLLSISVNSHFNRTLFRLTCLNYLIKRRSQNLKRRIGTCSKNKWCRGRITWRTYHQIKIQINPVLTSKEAYRRPIASTKPRRTLKDLGLSQDKPTNLLWASPWPKTEQLKSKIFTSKTPLNRYSKIIILAKTFRRLRANNSLETYQQTFLGTTMGSWDCAPPLNSSK